ncbi:MAG: hypothetical protein Fur0014_18440 [Rubrivivax sp.]
MACKVPRSRPWLVTALLLAASAAQAGRPPLPIFDAHLHYSHDAWERLPPAEAVALLRQAGPKAAMVSSSSDDGTQKLYAAAPDLVLPSHSDADAIERPFRQDPQARILWAHAGFDRPERVREMLRRCPNLWCDLAFRSDHASGGQVEPAWREAFLEVPDRFLVGTDTFTPERWHYVVEHARWSREWLADPPRPVAEQIAWRHGERLFGAMRAALKRGPLWPPGVWRSRCRRWPARRSRPMATRSPARG